MGDILVIGLIILITGFGIFKIIKNKKSGACSGCSGTCGGCEQKDKK